MFNIEPYQVRCRTCLSIFSYLNGFCTVCGGTSFFSLEKPVSNPEAKPTPEKKKFTVEAEA